MGEAFTSKYTLARAHAYTAMATQSLSHTEEGKEGKRKNLEGELAW